MNIIFWTLAYLFVGLLYGNIKWKLVYHTEQAKNGNWMKNPLFWVFFPWRTSLNTSSKRCYKSFTHARPEISDAVDELHIDTDHRNLHCYLILTIIFWGISLTWCIISLLAFIPAAYFIYYLCKWVVFPGFKVLIILPIWHLYNYTTFKLFQNCPEIVVAEND
ncbi:MAG: hypothetical protein V4686_01090 [Patescibacteria group bacterium]